MAKKKANKTAAANPSVQRYTKIDKEYVFKFPAQMFVEVEEEIATGKKVIRITRGIPQYNHWEHLRIAKPEYWKKLKEIIEGRLLDVAGWKKKDLQIDIAKVHQEQIKTLQGELNNLKKQKGKTKIVKEVDTEENKRLLEIIGKKEVDLSKAVADIQRLKVESERIKIRGLKTKIPKLEKELKEFEKLVNNKKKLEEDYHVYLKDHPWLFGATYIEVKSKPNPTAKDKPDFLLKRYDGFHDVVEIESANDTLFASQSNRLKMTGKLKDAISEIMDYIDAYIQQTMKEFYEEQREVYKPKGLVIIGKTKDKEKRELKQLNSFLHDIEVITFNDLIERARKTIDFIKKQK